MLFSAEFVTYTMLVLGFILLLATFTPTFDEAGFTGLVHDKMNGKEKIIYFIAGIALLIAGFLGI